MSPPRPPGASDLVRCDLPPDAVLPLLHLGGYPGRRRYVAVLWAPDGPHFEDGRLAASLRACGVARWRRHLAVARALASFDLQPAPQGDMPPDALLVDRAAGTLYGGPIHAVRQHILRTPQETVAGALLPVVRNLRRPVPPISLALLDEVPVTCLRCRYSAPASAFGRPHHSPNPCPRCRTNARP